MTTRAQTVKTGLLRSVELAKAYRELTQNIEGLSAAGAEGPDTTAPLCTRRERLLREWQDAQGEALRWIAAGDLPPLEYRILCLRYVRGQTWDEVVKEIGLTRRYIVARHTAAIERIAAALPPGRRNTDMVNPASRGAISS